MIANRLFDPFFRTFYPSLARLLLVLLGAFVWLVGQARCEAAETFDLVIKNGRIVDGTGSPWYQADIGVRGERIAHIGRIDKSAGKRVIDASGLIVAPGFIDMMGQTATPPLRNPRAARNLLSQGITTINAGEGGSAAPLGPDEARAEGWRTMAEYFQMLDLQGLPLNVAQTVGHTQVRQIVLGDVDRQPNEEELARMKDLVREAMEAGAIGVSTALIYPPAVYAKTDEIAELCKVAGEYGGRYYTHMRNEGDQLLEAIDEALEIGKKAGTPVHIFHLKAAGKQNWDKMPLAIERIKEARRAGQQVTADIYPYINNGLGMAALIHPRHFAKGRDKLRARLKDDRVLRKEIRAEMEADGKWENWYRHTGNDWSKIVVGSTPNRRYRSHAGESVAEIAKALDEDPWDTFFNLVISGAFVMPETMTETNKRRLIREEFISFCTDVGPAGGSTIASHPRAFGAFPRLLSRYVRDQGVVSLERAVAQASALAANEVMAYDRGRIAVGQAADIIAFDYEKLADRATFAEPDAESEGMRFVVVNGQTVLKNGRLTRRRPGRVLRGPGYRADLAPSEVDTGQGAEGLPQFDAMIRGFMRRHRLPGAALAVTDHGRLVFAKGYGYADLAAREKVKPTSLFRIASISKMFTSAAIMKLVEKGKISLDDKVFEILRYEPHLENGAKFDERQRDITLRHLLQHRGGWDRDQSFDAMFQSVRFAHSLGTPPPANQEQVIRCMLGIPLDFAPGERYAYSNYGYNLLGRVIEKVTGKPYETYVREEILAPLGIRSMRIGKTRLEGRCLPDEVRYYDQNVGPSVFAEDLGQQVSEPYGAWNLEAMDSHGGWIASAIDLARFACALDDPDSSPILSRKSIETLYERPPGAAGYDDQNQPKDSYYSLGWMNQAEGKGNWNRGHSGSLPGTATILTRRHDGRNIVVLFNSRQTALAPHLGKAVLPLLHRTARSVEKWPNIDLFDQFRIESE